jgi:hypothetical protein
MESFYFDKRSTKSNGGRFLKKKRKNSFAKAQNKYKEMLLSKIDSPEGISFGAIY